MKNRFIPVFLLLLLLFFSVPASAHPGRTDENGGHFVTDTGEYHYHHGYGAHQHSDIDGDGVLDCPYDFDDKTDSGRSGVSSHGTAHIYKDDSDTSSTDPDDSSDDGNKRGSPISVVFKPPWEGNAKPKEDGKNWLSVAGDMISYILDIRLRELPMHIAALAMIALYGYIAAVFIVGVSCAIIEKIKKKPVPHANKIILVSTIIFSVVLLLLCLFDEVA